MSGHVCCWLIQPREENDVTALPSCVNAATEIAILITITSMTLLYGLRSDLGDSSNILWLAILTILAVPYASAFTMACGDARAQLRSPSSRVSIEEIQIHAHTEGNDKNKAKAGQTTKATI